MGGVAGHLNHLYDNPDLTFKKIKEVFRLAEKGRLAAEEKVDGQNLFFSYDIKKKMPVAARNLGNIKQGGMSAADLAAKFAGRDVAISFVGGFDAFEKAVESLNPKEIRFIFGENTDYWYNGEVIHPGATNVINYDKSIIKIHDSGHKARDPETLRPVNFDFSDRLAVIDNALERIQSHIAEHEFDFVRSAVVQLGKISDGGITDEAERSIDSAISAVGLNDSSTVQEYVLERVKLILDADIPADKLEQLISRIVTGKPHLNVIKKGLNSEQLSDLREAMEASKLLLKHAIEPIEHTIHKFSVEVLRGLNSKFIIDNDKETKRLQASVADAVSQLQQQADEGGLSPEAMVVLERELRKIGDLENISTPTEGIVFDYDGVTYKFTGNFAPINQILGILLYGKHQTSPVTEGKEFSINRTITEGSGKKVALIPGGFKPPHSGHYDLVKHVASMEGITEARVIIGKNERCYKGTCITAEQSKAIWDTYTAKDSNITVSIQVGKTPVADVYDMIADQDQFSAGDTIVLVKSDKDVGDKRFDRARSYAERKNPGLELEQVTTKTFGGEGMGGTAMRELIFAGDKDKFLSKLPKHLSDDEKEDIWNLVTSYSEGFTAIDGLLDEVSLAGAVVGTPGAFSGTPNTYSPWKTNKNPTYRKASTKKPRRKHGKIQKRR